MIFSVLDYLILQIKEIGYVPNNVAVIIDDWLTNSNGTMLYCKCSVLGTLPAICCWDMINLLELCTSSDLGFPSNMLRHEIPHPHRGVRTIFLLEKRLLRYEFELSSLSGEY